MKRRKRQQQPECMMEAVVEDDLPVLYIKFDGKRIAKRGYPDTPYAKTWIPLEPGVVVRDENNMTRIVIEIYGVRVH